MDMIADRIIAAREGDWDARNRRTMAIANLGGATLDNEENYLIKKLLTALGVVQVENQARI
jgi:formate dehydrogenase major subunit